MILARIEALLEAHQPQEQHGFLSKAFDKANWNALWFALRDHGISDNPVSILQLIYTNQLGEVQGEHKTAILFPSMPKCYKAVC